MPGGHGGSPVVPALEGTERIVRGGLLARLATSVALGLIESPCLDEEVERAMV